MGEVTVPKIRASVFLPDDDGEYVLGHVDAARIEPNEISLEVRVQGIDGTEDVATVYLTDAEASRLAFALGALVLEAGV